MADTPIRPTSKSPAGPAEHHIKAKPDINRYYESVSGHYKRAKYFSIILLIAFLLSFMAVGRDEITLENLQYLMKFVSFTNTETSITATKINYTSSDKTRLSLFIGDLCYLSTNGYALYDSRGNTIMTDSPKYNTPILTISQKYALCYDLGGYTFAVYNTFSRLTTDTLDYPINDAAIADNGVFAIATSTREYRTSVQLYDANFDLTSRVLREDYLTDVKIKADGSEVAVVTSGSYNGAFRTTIDLITPGQETVRKSASVSGLGYTLYYTTSGLVMITDEEVTFFDADLNVLSAISHPSSLAMSDGSGKYIVCFYASGIIGNSYSAVIYDATGRKVFEDGIDGKLASVSHDDSGDYIFILAGNNITRVNLVNRKIGKIPVESGAFSVLAQSADSFLLGLKNYALTYSAVDFAEVYFDAADTAE